MVTQTEKESASIETQQLPTPPPEMADTPSIEPPSSSTDTKESSVAASTSSSDKVEETEIISKKEEKTDSSTQTESDSIKKDESKTDGKDSKPDDSKSDDKSKKKDDDKKDDKKEEEKKKALPRGMKADVKLLWAKTDAQCKCCTTWVEENPDEGKNVEESDECLQHAIVVRKKKKHEGNRRPLKVDSIVVHSPLIKKVLQQVFTGYPDLVVDLEELVFEAPFAPFFHRWETFEKAKNEEADPMTKSHLTLLYDALQAELKSVIQRHKDLVRHKAIDFDILWTLYTPGSLMFSHDSGHDRLYETGDYDYWTDLNGKKFSIRCEMIEWDGEKFGKVALSENISKFKGTRQITTLPSYPLRFHPKAEEMKAKCIARGRRFQELAGVHCKDYKGTGIEFTKYSVQTVQSKRHIEGRIMLDEELFSKFNPDETHDLRELDEDEEEAKKTEAEAAQRLEEQAKKAAEALAKAEKEAKEAEEAAKAAKVKAEKKEGDALDKTDEKSPSEETDKKEISEGTSTTETPEKPTDPKISGTDETEKAQKSSDDTSAAKEAPQTETNEAKQPETSSESKDDSSIDTDSTKSDIPTPTSETEEAEKPEEHSSEPSKDVKPFIQTEKQTLKDSQLAICSSWLRGYSLTYQKWASFSVEHISNVSWNDDAFNQLTLPPEYRELILATIQSQIRQNQWKQKMEKVDKEQKSLADLSSLVSKDETTTSDDENGAPTEFEFDDFIAQKGLGYIMLFSGNPGVGKTATAESIAELLHVPLCIISVGNLGTSAESVESALQDILELASKWNAVLLLDEADIFLEQRTKHDLHRNAVVSVFLRLLEYYQGVLCLTTNRSEEIDVAFHSRIHISLPFPDLTEGNREQIWRHFARITEGKAESAAVKRKGGKSGDTAETVSSTNGEKTTGLPPSSSSSTDVHHSSTNNNLIDLSNSDFRKLSQTPLNGRQIKNAFKTAVLLASYKKEKVSLKHVKTALKTIDGNGLGKREVGRMYY